jgi:hypothetical protein
MSVVLHKLARDGVILGDRSYADIQAGLADGSLRPADHVWAPGQGRWILLGELVALASPVAPKPAPAASPTAGFWRSLGRGCLAVLGGLFQGLAWVFKGIGTVMSWIVVISIGLFIGMLLEGRGNPRNNPATDPLHDPYAGRRDPDFDDPERDV